MNEKTYGSAECEAANSRKPFHQAQLAMAGRTYLAAHQLSRRIYHGRSTKLRLLLEDQSSFVAPQLPVVGLLQIYGDLHHRCATNCS
jgi:hypothetical protein